MNTQIDAAMKRSRGYWFVDGFAEMTVGVLFVLLGGILALRGLAAQGLFLTRLASFTTDIAIAKAAVIIAAILALWWLKNHFTYPRTGFVRERRLPLARLLPLARNAMLILLLPLLALVAAFLFLPAVRGLAFSMPAWLPMGLGVLWSVLCIRIEGQTGLRRFWRLAACILLAGIIVGVWQCAIGLPDFPAEALQSNPQGALPEALRAPLADSVHRTYIGGGLLTLVAGLAFAVSGATTFARYRKENPVPYEEEA